MLDGPSAKRPEGGQPAGPCTPALTRNNETTTARNDKTTLGPHGYDSTGGTRDDHDSTITDGHPGSPHRRLPTPPSSAEG